VEVPKMFILSMLQRFHISKKIKKKIKNVKRVCPKRKIKGQKEE